MPNLNDYLKTTEVVRLALDDEHESFRAACRRLNSYYSGSINPPDWIDKMIRDGDIIIRPSKNRTRNSYFASPEAADRLAEFIENEYVDQPEQSEPAASDSYGLNELVDSMETIDLEDGDTKLYAAGVIDSATVIPGKEKELNTLRAVTRMCKLFDIEPVPMLKDDSDVYVFTIDVAATINKITDMIEAVMEQKGVQ